MLTLTLFRHAKSSWADASLQDFDRPLNARGEKVAPRMGAYLAANRLVPGLILCSPAVRARQTLDLAFDKREARPETIYEDALYHADASAMVQLLRALPAKRRHVMIIGHNPGLQELAVVLTGSGDSGMRLAMATKFPAAGIAVIEFDVKRWKDIREGGGILKDLVTPKMLRDKD